MQLSTSGLICAVRPHGETGAVVQLLTREYGMIAGFVAGARGRQLRPVLIPGNLVAAEAHWRSEAQLPFIRAELLHSRGAWLGEPLVAAAIVWVTALAAQTLPDRQPFPALFDAAAALLDAVCQAPSARGWLPGLLAFETLLLRELGYGTETAQADSVELAAQLAAFDALGRRLARYPLAQRRTGAMGARALLRDRLAKIG